MDLDNMELSLSVGLFSRNLAMCYFVCFGYTTLRIHSFSACRPFPHIHFSGTYPTALTSPSCTTSFFSLLWTHLTAVRYLQGGPRSSSLSFKTFTSLAIQTCLPWEDQLGCISLHLSVYPPGLYLTGEKWQDESLSRDLFTSCQQDVSEEHTGILTDKSK